MKCLKSTLLTCWLYVYLCCSSDDVTSDSEIPKSGDAVLIHGTSHNGEYDEARAIYEPFAYQKLSQWIKTIVDDKGKACFMYLHIYKGEQDGENIYLVSSDIDNTIGNFYDKDGVRFDIGNMSYMDFFHTTTNWKMIYYYSFS